MICLRGVKYFFRSARYDTGRLRLPECLCLISQRPFFSIFNSVLATGQAFRLLQQTPPHPHHRTSHENTNSGVSGDVESISDWSSGSGSSFPPGGRKLEGLLTQLLAGGEGGGGVPGPGQELVACGLRFVRPVDEHMSLNDVPVTPLLVSVEFRRTIQHKTGLGFRQGTSECTENTKTSDRGRGHTHVGIGNSDTAVHKQHTQSIHLRGRRLPVRRHRSARPGKAASHRPGVEIAPVQNLRQWRRRRGRWQQTKRRVFKEGGRDREREGRRKEGETTNRRRSRKKARPATTSTTW